MKKILCLVLMVLGILPVNHSSAEKVWVDKAVLQKILERQEALEKEIKLLKETIKREKEAEKPQPVSESSPEDIEYTEEIMIEISDRLDKVEKRSILDNIRLHGELQTRLNHYKYKDIPGFNNEKRDGQNDELWSNRLRIGLRSEIMDNLIFHGRLAYYKYWGDTNYERQISDISFPSRPDSEGNIHVERAYIDYFIPQTPLSITLGRLPSSNGPPYEFRNNTTRKATWPMLANDGEFDGIIANLSLDKWTGWKNSMFRFAYHKLTQNYQQYSGVDFEDTRAWSLNFETEIPRMKNSLFWLGTDIIPKFHSIYKIIQDTDYPEYLGSINKYNAHFQWDNILNSGFGAFASYVYMDINTNSEGIVFREGNELGMPEGYEFGTLVDNGYFNQENTMGEHKRGYAFYLGLKYQLPFEKLNHPQLGLEYNYGSKNWFPAAIIGSGEFLNKLTVNGDAYEIYYIQPIYKDSMYCRLGLIYMDYNHEMNYLGPSKDSDMSILNAYFLLNVRF